MHVQYLGVPPLKHDAQKVQISGGFTTTSWLQHECLWNKNGNIYNIKRPLISSKFSEQWPAGSWNYIAHFDSTPAIIECHTVQCRCVWMLSVWCSLHRSQSSCGCCSRHWTRRDPNCCVLRPSSEKRRNASTRARPASVTKLKTTWGYQYHFYCRLSPLIVGRYFVYFQLPQRTSNEWPRDRSEDHQGAMV